MSAKFSIKLSVSLKKSLLAAIKIIGALIFKTIFLAFLSTRDEY